MKRHLLAYSVISLSLCSFVDLSVGWSSFVFIALAVLLVLHQREKGYPLPPVSVLLVAYVVGYPLVVALPDLYWEVWARVGGYNIEFAMRWALRGFSGFVCCYLLIDAIHRHFRPWQSRAGFDDGEEKRFVYLRYVLVSMGFLSVVGGALYYFLYGFKVGFLTAGGRFVVDSDLSSGRQILDFCNGLKIPFYFAFGILWRRRQLNRFLIVLCLALLVITLLEIVSQGSKGAIIRLLVVGVLIYACTLEWLSIKQFFQGAVVCLIFYMTFAIISEYRDIIRQDHRYGRDVFDISMQMETFANAFLATLPFAESSTRRIRTIENQDILDRVSSGGMFSFANLLRATGRNSPYEYAQQAFLLPLYTVLPRSLAPDKPVFLSSGRNAEEFYHTTTVGISVSTLGSLYFTWGYVGIVLGMSVFGGVLADMICRIRRSGSVSVIAFFVLPVVAIGMVDVGTTFANVAVSGFRMLYFLWGLRLTYVVFGKHLGVLLGVSPSLEKAARPIG